MKNFFYITSILSIIFISIASMSYLQFKIYSLQHKNAILQKENNDLEKNIKNLYENFKKFNNKNYNDKKDLDPNNNLYQNVPSNNSFNDFFKDFWDIDKNLQDMEKSFWQPKFQFNEKIGNTPWSHISLFKTFSINWNNFSYSIQSSNNKVSWKISWKDEKVLKEIETKLEKLWLKTSIEGNDLTFNWENIDINKITNIIDNYINQNSKNNKLPWEDKDPWKKKKLVPWKDYF